MSPLRNNSISAEDQATRKKHNLRLQKLKAEIHRQLI